MTEHCDSHGKHEDEMGKLWESVGKVSRLANRHQGMWIIVGIIIGIALIALFTITKINNSNNQSAIEKIGESAKETANNTAKIDKTVAAYMAANQERLNEITRRLGLCEEEIKELRR